MKTEAPAVRPLEAPEDKTTPTALKLPQEIQDMLGKIDAEFSTIENTVLAELPANTGNDTWDEAGKTVREALKKLLPRRRAFDSQTFFIVTFGMLKAGKSTLVNTFVGKEVSPVGSTKETTLRSSIVLAANKENPEGIYLYDALKSDNVSQEVRDKAKNGDMEAQKKWQEGKEAWRASKFQDLIQYLSGVMPREEFIQGVRESPRIDLSERKLEELLTQTTVPEHPDLLPPVIRIDVDQLELGNTSANLLRAGVGILDTPGVDGALSNAKTDPFWKILPNCCDYFLLVQSSMSAINKACLDLVQIIKGPGDNIPVHAVFNEIGAKFWMKPEEQKEKLRTDAVTAAEQLSRHLHGEIPPQISINAGEAADALDWQPEFKIGRQEMVKESRILELRELILNTISDRRIRIKVENAISRFAHELEAQKGVLETSADLLKEAGVKRAQKWKSDKEDILKALSFLKNAFGTSGDGGLLAKAFGDQMEALLEDHFKNNDNWIGGRKEEKNCVFKNRQGIGNNRKPNKTYMDVETVRKNLQDWIQAVSEDFKNYLSQQFTCHGLPLTVKPWDELLVAHKESLERIKEWKNTIMRKDGPVARQRNAADNQFPDLLFAGFNESSFVDPFPGEKSNNVVIQCVSRSDALFSWPPQARRPYGENTVWECECAKAAEKLENNLKTYYPKEAAKKVGDWLKDGIIKHGNNYTNELNGRVDAALGDKSADEERWQKENEDKIAAIRSAIGKLDKIKDLLKGGIGA